MIEAMKALAAAENAAVIRSWGHGEKLEPVVSRSKIKKMSDETFTNLWLAGLSSKEIAERIGCKYPAVNTRGRKLGLPKRKRGGS